MAMVRWLTRRRMPGLACLTIVLSLICQACGPAAPQLGEEMVRPADGMVMVYAPAGEFPMGLSGLVDDMEPVHTVELDGFWIDRTPVTAAHFRKFVEATGHETVAEKAGGSYLLEHEGKALQSLAGATWLHPTGPGSQPEDDHPVLHVAWSDADTYCEWVGGRLPTEAEWEYAARGPEGNVYPWGSEFDGTLLNWCEAACPVWDTTDEIHDGYAFTSPVGTFPGGASWCGALDMAGNVWEWTADWYRPDYYAESPRDNPTGPTAGANQRVVRGGSWWVGAPELNGSAFRLKYHPDATGNEIGFRCVVSGTGVDRTKN